MGRRRRPRAKAQKPLPKINMTSIIGMVGVYEAYKKYHTQTAQGGRIGGDAIVRAYKFVTGEYQSPFVVADSWNHDLNDDTRAAQPFTYTPGAILEEPNASANPRETCGRGIHVGTLHFCTCDMVTPDDSRLYEPYRVMAVEFKLSDIAKITVPDNWSWDHINYQKIRVFRCQVIEEVDRNGNTHPGHGWRDRLKWWTNRIKRAWIHRAKLRREERERKREAAVYRLMTRRP